MFHSDHRIIKRTSCQRNVKCKNEFTKNAGQVSIHRAVTGSVFTRQDPFAFLWARLIYITIPFL